MRRKLLIALLGLGVIAGYGGEIYRIRQFHKNGGAPFGRFCQQRGHCCHGGQRDSAPAGPVTPAAAQTDPAATK
ncbi:MAG TPA: hypothetical protein PKL17_03220 [Pseudomonadota bacterium]|nr:hypothetical protein [Pseudomonadota bacterium]HNF97539.1 hypothetical protein [Pseudomonadota bacterium]HNI58390.1 hypothetical protein [Pseudomonadota bacterium]HNK43765.1 hypothetical protein [Pseudomonadota bacterium]